MQESGDYTLIISWTNPRSKWFTQMMFVATLKDLGNRKIYVGAIF